MWQQPTQQQIRDRMKARQPADQAQQDGAQR
jgi:hypothetical protein